LAGSLHGILRQGETEITSGPIGHSMLCPYRADAVHRAASRGLTADDLTD
jgi:hypothetical protein